MQSGFYKPAPVAGTAAAYPNAWKFDGTSGSTGTRHIRFGNPLYQASSLLGKKAAFRAAIRFDGQGYAVSQSTGGAHVWLFGAQPLSGNMLSISGNVWRSDGAAGGGTWSTAEGPQIGEWCELAISLQLDPAGNVWIVVYLNGIGAGRILFASAASTLQRMAPASGGGSGPLFLGHSDHQGFVGECAGIWVCDDHCPINDSSVCFVPHKPSRFFGDEWNGFRSTLLALPSGAGVVADLSSGWHEGAGGTLYRHTGIPENGLGPGYPSPILVNDPSCPFGTSGDWVNDVGNAAAPAPPATIPPGSRIYDSFNGTPQDWFIQALSGPTLGPSDSRASLGAKTATQVMLTGSSVDSWIPISSKIFARRNGRLRCATSQACAYLYDHGSGDFDIRVRRKDADQWATTGLCARYKDTNNFLGVYISGRYPDPSTPAPNKYVWPMNVVNGSNTWFGKEFVPSVSTSFTWLRMTGVGGVVKIYVDDGTVDSNGWPAGWERIDDGSLSDTNFGAFTMHGPAQLGGAGVDGSTMFNADDYHAV